MKKRFAVVIAAGLALALSPGVAAKVKSSSTTQVEDFGAGRYGGVPPTVITGRVASKKSACRKGRKGRKVTAYHDTPPSGPDPNDFKLGEGTTDKDGSFKVSSPSFPDQVYVVVDEKAVRTASSTHKCKQGASKTVPVET